MENAKQAWQVTVAMGQYSRTWFNVMVRLCYDKSVIEISDESILLATAPISATLIEWNPPEPEDEPAAGSQPK